MLFGGGWLERFLGLRTVAGICARVAGICARIAGKSVRAILANSPPTPLNLKKMLPGWFGPDWLGPRPRTGWGCGCGLRVAGFGLGLGVCAWPGDRAGAWVWLNNTNDPRNPDPEWLQAGALAGALDSPGRGTLDFFHFFDFFDFFRKTKKIKKINKKILIFFEKAKKRKQSKKSIKFF